MKNNLRARARYLTGTALVAAGIFITQSAGCSPASSPSSPSGDAAAQAGGAPGGAVSNSSSPGQTIGAAQPASDAAESHKNERGKAIYFTATSPSGQRITARLGGSSTDVPAAVLTCQNCHGRDGIGKPEGGIAPATITWDELTKDYGPSHPSGRRRPAYDARTIRRAIAMGLDPTGRALDPSMPRYALTHEDMDDLVGYLKELGRDRDPGITDQAIAVGTLLAPPSSLVELNRAVKSVLTAYFQETNDRGGIFGRRVELNCLDVPEGMQERAVAGRRFLKSHEVFAFVAPFIAGFEDELDRTARAESVPVLGPFTRYPNPGEPINRHVFYLHAGLIDQVRVLAVFAGDRLSPKLPVATVVCAENVPELRTAADAVRAEGARLGWPEVEVLPVSTGAQSSPLVDRLEGKKYDLVFVLAPIDREIAELLSAVARGSQPVVLIPGALAGHDVLKTSSGRRDRLFLSFPTSPLDHTTDGIAEYERLAAKYKLPKVHRSSQIEALAAAKIFVDGMTAAGRSVSREKLIEQLENFYEKPTGLTRPITFGPNRRFGARGAYILGIDPKEAKLVPVSGFIEPPPR
jgi:ABC-type branched-subunit amino acid transport system substrate-binding protein